MSAKVDPQAETAAFSTRERHPHGYRVVILPDDGGDVQEVRLPAVMQWLSFVLPIVLALCLSGLMFFFGAYLHATNVSRVQTARIHHLTVSAAHGKRVIGSYQAGLALTSTISAETSHLISSVKAAEAHLARITHKGTPGARGLADILKVLKEIEGLLPAAPNATGSH